MFHQRLALPIFLSVALGSSISALGIQEGFLGLQTGLTGRLGSAEISGTVTREPIVMLPFTIIGASEVYDLYTSIDFFSDALQLGNYYSADKSILKGQDVYDFSFLSIESSYSMKRFKHFQFLLGVSLGHRGFLSNSFDRNTLGIYAGPVATVYWFLSKHFALKER